MKKKVVIQRLARSYNLIHKSKHPRTSFQLVDKLKNDVYSFYIREDISYPLSGKKDTIVIKQDDGNKITYKKTSSI